MTVEHHGYRLQKNDRNRKHKSVVFLQYITSKGKPVLQHDPTEPKTDILWIAVQQNINQNSISILANRDFSGILTSSVLSSFFFSHTHKHKFLVES